MVTSLHCNEMEVECNKHPLPRSQAEQSPITGPLEHSPTFPSLSPSIVPVPCPPPAPHRSQSEPSTVPRPDALFVYRPGPDIFHNPNPRLVRVVQGYSVGRSKPTSWVRGP